MSLDAEKVKAYVNDKLLEAMQELEQDIVGEMKAKAPVDTGYLQNHITGETQVQGDFVVTDFKSEAPYSLYVDKGTSKMGAQPYFEVCLLGYERRLQAKLRG